MINAGLSLKEVAVYIDLNAGLSLKEVRVYIDYKCWSVPRKRSASVH